MWKVRYTDLFAGWWRELSSCEQDAVLYSIGLLEQLGPALGRPHADTVAGSRFPNMKELRCQYRGRPYRILFAFDPLRQAILLTGGDKTADNRFYTRMIRQADRVYSDHLQTLKRK